MSGGDFDEFDSLVSAPTPSGVEAAPASPTYDGDAAADNRDVDVDVDGVAGSHSLRPTTGHPQVDAATAMLDGLEQLPTAAHPEIFEEVHRHLQGALSDLDHD